MFTVLGKIYKVPLLISITLAIILIALTVAKTPVAIGLIVIGTLLGTFLLDLDYYLHAYFFDGETEFAQNLKLYIRDHDYKNAISFVNTNKRFLAEKTLNSALFQLCLAGLAFFLITARGNLFLQAFIMSAYVNSMYKYAELYYTQQNPDSWFWIMKNKPTKQGQEAYGILLIIIAIILLTFF